MPPLSGGSRSGRACVCIVCRQETSDRDATQPVVLVVVCACRMDAAGHCCSCLFLPEPLLFPYNAAVPKGPDL